MFMVACRLTAADDVSPLAAAAAAATSPVYMCMLRNPFQCCTRRHRVRVYLKFIESLERARLADGRRATGALRTIEVLLSDGSRVYAGEIRNRWLWGVRTRNKLHFRKQCMEKFALRVCG